MLVPSFFFSQTSLAAPLLLKYSRFDQDMLGVERRLRWRSYSYSGFGINGWSFGIRGVNDMQLYTGHNGSQLDIKVPLTAQRIT